MVAWTRLAETTRMKKSFGRLAPPELLMNWIQGVRERSERWFLCFDFCSWITCFLILWLPGEHFSGFLFYVSGFVLFFTYSYSCFCFCLIASAVSLGFSSLSVLFPHSFLITSAVPWIHPRCAFPVLTSSLGFGAMFPAPYFQISTKATVILPVIQAENPLPLLH